MDGEMGLAAALHAMAQENGRSREDWAMFSALPDAPVDGALSTRERIVDRIKRLVRRVRTGRTEVRGPAELDPTPCSESRVRHKTRRATASVTGVSSSQTRLSEHGREPAASRPRVV